MKLTQRGKVVLLITALLGLVLMFYAVDHLNWMGDHWCLKSLLECDFPTQPQVLDEGRGQVYPLSQPLTEDKQTKGQNMAIEWQSKLTSKMIKHLTDNEASLLINQLNDAVMEICQSFEVPA